MKQEFAQAIDNLCDQAKVDYVGLWEILRRVQKISHPKTEEELRSLVLEFVRDMFARGFQAVDLAPAGRCVPWQNQDPDYMLGRIESEWKTLGREPNVGEIAWFDHPSSS